MSWDLNKDKKSTPKAEICRVEELVQPVQLMGNVFRGVFRGSDLEKVDFYMGLSENSVANDPMVNDHYPYQMAIIGGIPHFQTYPYDSIWIKWIYVMNYWGL